MSLASDEEESALPRFVFHCLIETITCDKVIYISIVLYLLCKVYQLVTFHEIIGSSSHCTVGENSDRIKRLYKLCQDLPPFYPNGWIAIVESRQLLKTQVKHVRAFGHDLVVYRGTSGKVYVMDAYCPHLGANISVGGRVIGESIRCPFHGWTFDSSGMCSEVPYIDSSKALPKASINAWDCVEINGFVFVWHHSDQQKAEWFPIRVEQIENKELVYRGRAEHLVNCHLQEIPENGADVMHLNELHSDPEFLDTVADRQPYHKLIQRIIRYEWTASWSPRTAPDQHIACLQLSSKYTLFGFTLMSVALSVQQIGPASVHLEIDIDFFGSVKGFIIQTITPLAPMHNKIVHHFYTEPTLKAFFISKFMIYGEARMVSLVCTFDSTLIGDLQVERDVIIWNNKKFLKQPYFAKNEVALVKFRRWFSQFYIDKCPKSFNE